MNIVNLGWDHGHLFDYWSFVHTLTGVIAGCSIVLLGLPFFSAGIAVFFLLVWYEGLELVLEVVEGPYNVASDIVLATLGMCVILLSVLRFDVSLAFIISTLVIALIAIGVLLRLGWVNFLRNKMEQQSSKERKAIIRVRAILMILAASITLPAFFIFPQYPVLGVLWFIASGLSILSIMMSRRSSP